LPPTQHNDARVAYTWRNDGSSFFPGLLDFIFYTGSAVNLRNHYVLDTRTMLPSTLSTNSLLVGDTELSSDHSARVADFDFSVGTAATPALEVGVRLLPNVPNPFNPRTSIRYRVEAGVDQLTLRIFDVDGRLVRSLAEGPALSGLHSSIWDGVDSAGEAVASGVYYVEVEAGALRSSQKITLVR